MSASLSDFIVPKQEAEPANTARTANEAQAKDHKRVYFRADPKTRRQLRQLALDRDTSGQQLLIEAVGDLFQKYNLPPIT